MDGLKALWGITWKAGLLAVAAVLLWKQAHPALAILLVPVAGKWIGPSVVEGIAAYLAWAKRQPYAAWQGRYYEFTGVHIRLYEVRNELWAVDSDLLRVVGQKPSLMLESLYDCHEYDAIPNTKHQGFSPEGAENYLRSQPHPEAGKMLLWLKREVYAVHQRAREREAQARHDR